MKPTNKGYEVTSAEPADGPALLRLIESDASKGGLAIVASRQPDPVASFALESKTTSLTILRDPVSGTIRFMAAFIPRRVFIGGHPVELVYVSSVRKQAGTLSGVNVFHQAYARELATRGAFGGFCSILAENRAAAALFAGKKHRILPQLKPLCDSTTFLINPRALAKMTLARGRNADSHPTKETLRATVPKEADLPEVLDFLQTEGRRYDLFPVVENLSDTCSGLSLEDCVLVRDQGGAIQAFGALWDQRHYRQSIIRGYRGIYRWVRPFSWLIKRLGYIPLPPAGSTVPVRMLSLLLAQPGADDAYCLLLTALSDMARQRGCPIVAVSISHNNACLPLWQRLRSLRVDSTIYTYETPGNTAPLPDGSREIQLESGLL
jgi:hypothetical protein